MLRRLNRVESVKRVTHLFVGASIGLILCHNPSLCFYTILPSVIGSYIPDFDLKKSHRKLLHNFLSALVLATLMWLSLNYIRFTLPVSRITLLWAFLIGYMSHLFLDILTLKGVALFYPFSKRVFSAGLCKSNSFLANLIFIMVSIMIILLRVYEMIGEKIFSLILGFLP